jgi:uncharacterized SAM-binding protein YcdF (DUF218 family)
MPDECRPDAVIVIFGAAVRPGGRPSGALRLRVDAAFAFGRGRSKPLYVPTGAQGRFGPAEAIVMAELLRQHGVSERWILQETTGTDTLASVRAVVALLRQHDLAAPVFAATSRYHLPRCVLLLRLAGLRAHACPAPPIPASQRFLWRWYWRLREVPAALYDLTLLVGLRLAGRI